MTCKILINAIDPGECRIAKVIDSKLEEFHIESKAKEITHGNIYKGIITRVEPSLQAAFIDYGAERNGFLQKHEIHSDYYQDNLSGDRSISNVVKPGQELLVQITKDPVMQKGAMLTTYISLAGRQLVLMPGSRNQGISRKIEDEAERNRLKEMINSLNIPQGFGIIVRTISNRCTKAMISKDLKYLLRLWKNIKKRGINSSAPCLIHKERNLAVRSIRDYYTPDVKEIMIDDEAVFHEVKDFLSIIASKRKKIVKFYKIDKPLFTKFQLEDQIATIFKNRVDLKSGGSIVISPTEALVSIDVNSGKATHQSSIEETALATNLEAAEEVCRQLRLRDLGGLIVIDFIDMRDAKHKLEIERAMKKHLKVDKARTKVGRISRFGLMEMSRQRLRPSIEFSTYETCKHCRGKGLTPSTETLALNFLRKLNQEIVQKSATRLKGTVPPPLADFLLNNKRKEILDLEARHRVNIFIEGESEMIPGESKISALK
jgi:ribonuclease E